MTAKQTPGIYAPDGSLYITLTDGSGNLVNIGATSLSVGTTTVSGGVTGRLLYDNAGVLGEYLVGTGTATALSVNVGTAGSVVVNGGALGTPSSGVATNLTGTAAGLTAGHVTTNANLTGDVTSVGNATTIANKTGTGNVVLSDSPVLTTLATIQGDGVTASASIDRYSTDAVAGNVTFRKARGSLASPTAVVAADNVGIVTSSAYDGTAFRQIGLQSYSIDTVTGSDNLSSYWRIFTRPDGNGAAATERLRVTKTGGLNVGTYTTDPGAGNVNITGSYTGAGTGLTGTAAGLTAGNVTAGWHTLKQANVEQTVVTGTTSKTTSFSVTVPGGTLGVNGRLRITAIWRYTGTAGNKTPGLDFGGTTFWTAGSQVSGSLITVPVSLVIANRNSTSSQIAVNNATATGTGNAAADIVTGSINTAVDQTLALTVTLGNGGDTGAVESVMVEYNNDNP